MAVTPTNPANLFDGQQIFATSTVGTTPGPFPSAGLNRVDVTLTSAQILALMTTAIPLVSAPGVGFWINPMYVILRYTGGSVAYTDAGGAVSVGNPSGGN